MKKNNLRNGMLIQDRNGNIALFINKTFIYHQLNSYRYLDSHYTEDLKLTYNPEGDIMKVSKVLKGSMLIPSYWNIDTLVNNLKWERKE